MPRNIETREGYEFWDRLCRLQRYSFFLGAGPSVRRVEDGTGNWIEVYGAQSVMDDAQSEINELREQNAKLAAEAQALREEVAALRKSEIVGSYTIKHMAIDIAAVGEALGISAEDQEGGTGEFIDLIEEMKVARAGQVPEAWLDVQAERRRQIEAEGWTPDHDDEHGGGQMARAAACYALAGSCSPNDETAAILVDLAWPWAPEWWKPTTSRRDLVKSAALILAELERLDRAAAPAQGGSADE